MASRGVILHEEFQTRLIRKELQWHCLPPSQTVQDGQLTVQTAGETDFWQRTHYGFQNHNGHFLHLPNIRGDFIVCTNVATSPQQRFDQAGLMVLMSPSCWLKTSVEYGGPGRPSQLGVVVTNAGYSDWSTLDFPNSVTTLALRVRREGSDYIVEACVPEASLAPTAPSHAPIRISSGATDSAAADWTQLRICHLLEDVSPAGVGTDGDENILHGQRLQDMAGLVPLSGVAAGLYACSPKPGDGFTARFSKLHIVAGRIAGHM